MVPPPVVTEGFFSIFRYVPDPGRAEPRNVAVVVVDTDRDLARVRVAPISQVAPRLDEHGILDALIVQFAANLERGELRDLKRFEDFTQELGPTLSFSPPRTAAIVNSIDETLKSLYKAYVAPKRGRGSTNSRGAILDRVVQMCRDAGARIEPGSYVRDVLFDAIVQGTGTRAAIQVLSFETEALSPRGAELSAGYFLHGLRRVQADGICVAQPPHDAASAAARISFDRVSRWMGDAGVQVVAPDRFLPIANSMAGFESLPLVMAT